MACISGRAYCKSRLIDAPPADMGVDEVVRQASGYELIIINTSTPTIANDVGIAQSLKTIIRDQSRTLSDLTP